MAVVVKRRGHKEKFDERKLYASIYAAFASAHYSELHCEKEAEQLTKRVKGFVKNKKEVSSTEIRKRIDSELKKKNSEVAFFYEHHLPNLKRL